MPGGTRIAIKLERPPTSSGAPVTISPMCGISIVIPVYNAGNTLHECLQAATTLKWQGDIEVIVVNDGSTDSTSDIVSSFTGVKVIDAPHGGIPYATNLGIKAAHHDIVVLLDSDAVLERDWLVKILPAFDDPNVVAVAGYAVTANDSIIGKIMGYDVESRLRRVPVNSDHVYTMNTAFRRELLLNIGLLDEELKAGQDVDLSRRLKAAGYSLILNREATCRHYWKDSLGSYLRQQYSYAYYRMELAKRWGKPHDQVTGLGMILQVPLTIAIVVAACTATLLTPMTLLLLLILPLIHLPKAFGLLASKRDASALLLPLLFMARNICWVCAAIGLVATRLIRLLYTSCKKKEFRRFEPKPQHSNGRL